MTQPCRTAGHQPACPALRRFAGALAGLLACATALAAGGLPLADPTRPPAAAAPPAAARAAAAAALQAPPAPVLPPPQLQAVKLPQRGLPSALVDGHWLGVGDLLQGRRVLAIDAGGLLWQGKAGDERLTLLEGTPKQAAGSITLNRSARYVPAATPDSSAKGLAGAGPGMPPAATPAPQGPPGAAPGDGADKEQPLSVAGRNSR